MASYELTHTNTTVTFNVTGLSYGDRVRLYVRYDRLDKEVTVVDEMYTASGSTLNRTFPIPSDSSYAANCNVNDVWLGTEYFSTGSDEPEPERPSDWYWSVDITAGRPITLSAREWNRFCTRINEFREYKGLGYYDFTTVIPGQPMRASEAKEAWTAINAISGHGPLPSNVAPGGAIKASFFNQLAEALNAVE